jgi:hypothetical protein
MPKDTLLGSKPSSESPAVASSAEPVKTTVRLGALSNSELAALSNEEALARLEDIVRVRAALDGHIAQVAAEIERRQAFRERGATSLVAHLAGGCGFSAASARVIAHVGERLFDLPHLQAALSSGELSLDQVRAVVGVAQPESDADWVEAARGGALVADLARLAERRAADAKPPDDSSRPDDSSKPVDSSRRPVNGGPTQRSVRFNDACCTMTARLPKADFAWVRGVVDARVKALGSDGETPLDERAGDALMSLLIDAQTPSGLGEKSPSGHPSMSTQSVVVAHIELKTLLDESDGTRLLADLERAGLVSVDVVRRLGCDATFVAALDDEAGHTMYEGRARRFPTETQRRELWRRDRHCRFPGCSNDRFTRVHHVVPWKPDGRTDLENLVILCEHHHHEVHSERWNVSGDANVVLTFSGPGGHQMTSRPSALWGTVGASPRTSPAPAG